MKNKLTKGLIPTIAIVSLAVAGCGMGTEGTQFATETEGTPTESDVTAIVISGGGSTLETASATEADMNAKIFNVITEKVEEELNRQLESGELDSILEDGEPTEISTKDLRVGFGKRGISVFIEDEAIPFAGGEMILNGEVGLKLKYRGGGKLELIASGDLTSFLDGVERSGMIKEIPYSLELEGSNDMEMNGSLIAHIKRWRIRSLSAALTSAIVDSDVTAHGSVAGKEVEGSVDMVDVAVKISNDNILENPAAVKIECTGVIETLINDNPVASCEIATSCLGCK